MSLVLFRQDELVVDRSGLEIRNNRDEAVPAPSEVKKMYVSRDKRIAVAYTGPEIDFKSPAFSEQLRVFKSVITKMQGGVDGVASSVYILDAYKDVIFFVMTASVCYEIVKVQRCKMTGSYSGTMYPLDRTTYTTHGSGTYAAEYLLATKPMVSNDTVFKVVARHTPNIWETPLDRIKFSDLKPFMKEVKHAKPVSPSNRHRRDRVLDQPVAVDGQENTHPEQ